MPIPRMKCPKCNCFMYPFKAYVLTDETTIIGLHVTWTHRARTHSIEIGADYEIDGKEIKDA